MVDEGASGLKVIGRSKEGEQPPRISKLPKRLKVARSHTAAISLPK